MNPIPQPTPSPDPDDWNAAKPDIISEPTFWPAALALGSMLGLWGLASSLIISGIGLCLFAISLAGWIADIRHERRIQQPGPARPPN